MTTFLPCVHCKCEFEASPRQAKRAKYEKNHNFTCSEICKRAYASAKLSKPIPTLGPCPTCGEKFKSRRLEKKFCSMKCYTRSDLFKANQEKAVAASYLDKHGTKATSREEYIKQNTKPCLSCGKDFFSRPARNAKFCSTMCYRTYMAERFDRWVANPEEIALPQNYDEFLTQDELPCLVEGCGWKGQSLSGHMNLCHGVPQGEFKRAAGFNLSTGVVSKELHETLVDREGVGVASLTESQRQEFLLARKDVKPKIRDYRSLEADEHSRKSRHIIAELGDKPTRRCKGCGTLFQQSTPFGRTKFCSVDCRYKLYQEELNAKKYPMACHVCSEEFRGNIYQKRRFDKDLVVVCSTTCRQHRAGKIARGTWEESR